MPSHYGLDFGSADFSGGGSGFGNLTGNAIKNQGGTGLGGSLGFGDTSGSLTTPGGGLFGAGGGASIALGGLQTLGSIWSSFQQMKLAKKSLKFQKNAFKTNLANSTKVYNTALEDRIRARYATEGRPEEADAKIAENRL